MNIQLFNAKLAPYSQRKAQSEVPVCFLSNIRLGTGYYRMLWPHRALMDSEACMPIHNPHFLSSVKDVTEYASIKTSYSISDKRFEQWKEIRGIADKAGTKLIYDCDDVFFADLIPEFNAGRERFASRQHLIVDSMEISDEITVCSQYMKDLFLSRLKNKNISVVENMIPRDWFYNDLNIDKHLKKYDAPVKPRILWAPSASHVDASGKHIDDSTHVVEAIKKTVDKYEWIIMCAVPSALVDSIKAGKIRYVNPVTTPDYPRVLKNIDPHVIIAPLHDNEFNRAKSDIKILESHAMGIPCVTQDLPCYANNFENCKFKTGDEMIDRIETVLKEEMYANRMNERYNLASNRFIEKRENLMQHVELMLTPFSTNRRFLV